MRIEHSHGLQMPVEYAFSYITDPANWTEFWPGLARVEQVEDWPNPGGRAQVVIRFLGRETTLVMALTLYEHQRFVGYTSVQKGLPNARHERRFEPTSAGCLYSLAVEYEPRPGPSGFVDRFVLPRAIERTLRRTTANLERCFAARLAPGDIS